MFQVRHYLTDDQRDVYLEWLKKVRDPIAKGHVIRRVNRMAEGNFGDHKFCRDGVCCGTMCSSLCNACAAVKKGVGVDGECGKIQSGSDPAAECEVSGAIVAQPPPACPLSGEVDEAVARPGIEGERADGPPHDGHVGDPAEILQRAHRSATEERRVKVRHERGSLSSSGKVAHPKVGDDWEAGTLRDDRRLAELEC